MERVEKSFFSEEDAEPFVEVLRYLWPKQIAENWFWLAFQALEKSGLTYYENSEEEIQVRERLSLLGILYYEFCILSASHESQNFNYWSEETIIQLKKDLSDEADDELCEVRQALIKYFGSEEKVLAELWINCMEGANNRIIKLEEKVDFFNEFIGIEYHDMNQVKVNDWFVGWTTTLYDFESLSI